MMAQSSQQPEDTSSQYDENEENEIRQSWHINSHCQIYSRSHKKWFDGQITDIKHINNIEWLIVKYKNKTKKIQRQCNDIKHIPRTHASLFAIHSLCKIYSRNQWFNGEVIAIFTDSEGEWLTIKYSEKGCVKICDIQRYNPEIELVINDNINNTAHNSLKNIWKTHSKVMEEWLKKEERNIPKQWTLLASNNDNLCRTIKYSNVIPLNANEFIVAPNQSFENPLDNNGLYKYNVTENKWSLFIAYPNQFVAEQHYICMDYAKQCIYIYYYLGALCKIHIRTHKFEWFEPKNDDDYKMEGEMSIFGDGALSVVIDNELNIFWSKDSASHQIFNEQSKQLQMVKMFDFCDESKGRMSYAMVYNRNKGYILLFGGFKGNGLGRSDEIWKYAIENKKWEKCECCMPDRMQSFGCVLDLECKYVFVLGGSDSNGFSDSIYILELDSMEWKKSKVICPIKGVHTGSVVITKNNSDVQFLHILQGNYRHFQASVSDILSWKCV